MTWKEFFHIFYCRENKGGIIGYKSQIKTVAFFFEYAVSEDCPDIPFASDKSYEQWFNGGRNPESTFINCILDNFDHKRLENALVEKLNPRNLRTLIVASHIELSISEIPDVYQFAYATASQFEALLKTHGDAKNVFQEKYKKVLSTIGFENYISNAINNWETMKIFGLEDEWPLENNFICPNLSLNPVVFPNKNTTGIIENADLTKLCTFDKRGITKYIILVGSCGQGKTLMLQYLFLDAAKKYRKETPLPILVELRDLAYHHHDLLECIIYSVLDKDPTLSSDDIVKELRRGRCQILMDGVDELGPDEKEIFQKKLEELQSGYPENQYVLASRECDTLKGIAHFIKLYLLPLNSEQSDRLINSILKLCDGEHNREKVLHYVYDGFITKDGAVASNPMILSYVASHHNILDNILNKKIDFYEQIFNAILTEHDKRKGHFRRFFHSVQGAEQFREIFREFCAKTYIKAAYEFDKRSFEKYFKNLASLKSPYTGPSLTRDNFLQDACATACMMYEHDTKIYYIDPGFQEYLFADYYYFADPKEFEDDCKPLRKKLITDFKNTGGFDMLYQIDREKVDACLFLPFLRDIFIGKTKKDSFIRFLATAYETIRYTVIDNSILKHYLNQLQIADYENFTFINEISNLILSIFFRYCHLTIENALIIETPNKAIAYEENRISYLIAEYMTATDDKPGRSVLVHTSDPGIYDPLPRNFIRDRDNRIIVFGGDYDFPAEKLQMYPDKYNDLIDEIASTLPANKMLLALKNYLTEIQEYRAH